MRSGIALVLLGLSGCATGIDSSNQATIEPQLFDATGSKTELLSRARTCVAKLVRYEPIRVNTAGVAELVLGAASDAQRFTDIPGGEVIVDSNPDTGTLVANNRTSSTFLRQPFYIDSLLTIETRDGRFRLSHSDVKTDAREPLGKMRGLTTPAIESLTKQTAAIADCIRSGKDDF